MEKTVPPITIVLTAQQVVDAPTIILTDAQLASIHQQEAPPIIITPPAAGGIVLPPEVAGRQVIITPMPWKSGAPRVTADLNDSNVWALPFTPTAFTSAHFAGGEWQSQPWWRLFALIRNRDGVVITRSPSYGVQTPSINMVPGRSEEPHV